jgi:2-aminoethylphosphonate-pyruvate transaminase
MILLIPGPVTTDPRVREAAARDYAPWDQDFRALYRSVLQRALAAAGGVEGEHSCVALQGCGHFALEAALRTLTPPGARMLIAMSGQYADRAARLAREAGREVLELPVAEGERTDPEALRAALAADPTIGHVLLVYSETATGVLHDVPALARVVGEQGRRAIVDGVSALGAAPFPLAELPAVDAVVFTSNKCIEGIPGLGLVVGRVDAFEAGRGRAGSWSLDLADIHDHKTRAPGSFRFTPPAQALAAFSVALDLWAAEGREARLARYTANKDALMTGLRAIGLRPMLRDAMQGPVVVNVHAPADPAWDLQRFVDALKARGFTISNFVNTAEPGFRVGCIGAITPADMTRAVAAMQGALADIGIGALAPVAEAA